MYTYLKDSFPILSQKAPEYEGKISGWSRLFEKILPRFQKISRRKKPASC